MAAVSKGPGDGIAPSSSNRALARSQTPPPPPQKEGVRTPGGGVDAFFNSPRLSRAGSIYSLSRASFATQLNQLTSLNLPDASTLSSSVAAIPSSSVAAKALGNAAVQIQQWIQKAEEVLGGLDAEDDVEWAAAGGKDGVQEVEAAIKKFEKLVNVYLAAMEDLRKRSDIDDAPRAEFKFSLDIMDRVVKSWANVNRLLAEVKRQVQIALEFEGIWNTDLGELSQEIEALNLLVFEMEESRNHGPGQDGNTVDTNLHVDIQELQTIMEETHARDSPRARAGNRLSLLPALATSTSPSRSPGGTSPVRDDSRLIELFARLQPLRASLDFLPIKLSDYRSRAEDIVPSACDELDGLLEKLEEKYASLQGDADRLRAELQEDNWLAAFRNTDRQARKLFKSVELGIAKLQEALESESATANQSGLQKKISDYEAKKNYYIPNLRKIIQIIDNGAKSRKTVNGEVLRIQNDSKEMWDTLQIHIDEVEAALEKLSIHRSQHLRESVSTIVSTDLSTNESAIETPVSSPASSVYMGPPSKNVPSTPDANGGSRTSSLRSISGSRSSALMGKPRTASGNSLTKRISSNPMARLTSASPSPSTRTSSSNTPTPRRTSGAPPSSEKRPRWNASPVINYKDYGYHKGSPKEKSKPLNSKPSVYSFRGRDSTSANLAHSSPLARDKSPTNSPSSYRGSVKRAISSMGLRTSGRSSSLAGSPQSSKVSPRKDSPEVRPHSRSYKPTTPANVHIPHVPSTGSSGKRVSLLPVPAHHGSSMAYEDEVLGEGETSPTFKASLARRPATSMGTGRRTSLLPVPK